MKKLLISIMLFFPLIVFSQNNWHKANVINQYVSNSSFSYINADIGYALLNKSPLTIYKTTNKGLNWIERNNDLSSVGSFNYPSIKFINENTGFLITTASTEDWQKVELYFYKTTNGGTNWLYVNGPVHDYHWGFFGNANTKTTPIFTDNNTAYINTYFAILKTNNSFQSFDTILRWNSVEKFYILDFDIDKDNIDIMYAGSGKGLIKDGIPDLKTTTNGGVNWDYIHSQNSDYGAIFQLNIFNNNGNRFIRYLGNSNTSFYGRPNVITEFNNGNFTVISDLQIQFPNDYFDGAYMMDFIDNNTGYVTCKNYSSIGGYQILNTTDGGFSWNNNPTFDLNPGEILDNRVPFSKYGDILYMRGRTNNSEFVLFNEINANLVAKSDYTETPTNNVYMYLNDYISNVYPNNPANQTPIPVYGGRQKVYINSSNSSDLFYRWHNNYYLMNPMNSGAYNNEYNYYVDKNGEKIQADFKTKQISTTINAISDKSTTSSCIQTTSILDTNNYLHQIHESMEGVFYTRSTNGGSNWNTEEVVNKNTEYFTELNDAGYDKNAYPSLCELRTVAYGNPFIQAHNEYNVAATWQHYSTSTQKTEIRVAFRQPTYWRQYGNQFNSTYNYHFGNGIITSFNSSEGYKSKPKIFATILDGDDYPDPYNYLILIPHLEPSTSGNKIIVKTKHKNYYIYDYNNQNGFIIDNGNISDFSVTAVPYVEGAYGGFVLHFAYIKDGNVIYCSYKIGLTSVPGQGYSVTGNAIGNFENISLNDNQITRITPDISIRGGRPIVTYRATSIIQRVAGFQNNEDLIISITNFPIFVKYKYLTTNNDEVWSTPIIYNSAGIEQKNPNVEGNRFGNAFVLNYLYNNNQYRQTAYLETNPGYCSPGVYGVADAKLVRGSFRGSSYPNNSPVLLTLNQSGSLYNLSKESFTVYNIPNYNTNVMDNLIGTVREQNVNYNFDLGPIIVKNTNVSFPNQSQTSVDNYTEFSNTMTSAPFSLGPNDTLIFNGTGYYNKISGTPFTQKRFFVNLMNKSTQSLYMTLLSDSIGVNDTVETEYLNGIIFDENLMPKVDSFYIQLVLDSSSLYPSEDNYVVCNAYSPNEYLSNGDNSSLPKSIVHFKKTNVNHKDTPQKYSLLQNYPNPFNPVTNIKYQIPKDGLVTLKVYDITGREIAKLVNEVKQVGSYTVSFNGSNFASGVYFYRIQAGDFVQVKKMVLIK